MPDTERQLLLVLVTQAWVRLKDDPEMRTEAAECERILCRLYGTDTRVLVERTYPSHIRVRD